VTLGVSLFLIAIGAILAWAVEVETRGIDLGLVGVILMVVGAVGLLLSLTIWGTYTPFGRRETRVVREEPPENL
jgi:hypothetical protein